MSPIHPLCLRQQTVVGQCPLCPRNSSALTPTADFRGSTAGCLRLASRPGKFHPQDRVPSTKISEPECGNRTGRRARPTSACGYKQTSSRPNLRSAYPPTGDIRAPMSVNRLWMPARPAPGPSRARGARAAPRKCSPSRAEQITADADKLTDLPANPCWRFRAWV